MPAVFSETSKEHRPLVQILTVLVQLHRKILLLSFNTQKPRCVGQVSTARRLVERTFQLRLSCCMGSMRLSSIFGRFVIQCITATPHPPLLVTCVPSALPSVPRRAGRVWAVGGPCAAHGSSPSHVKSAYVCVGRPALVLLLVWGDECVSSYVGGEWRCCGPNMKPRCVTSTHFEW